MSEGLRDYTLTIFSEDQTGLMQRIVNVITRRHIDIRSITASPSSMDGIFRFTIVVELDEVRVKKLCAQLEKQVDVLKAFYYDNQEIIFQELALFKVPASTFFENEGLERLIRRSSARILSVEQEYVVIEKTGHRQEIDELLASLKEIGIYEYANSGRVAIVKPMEKLNNYLKSLQRSPQGEPALDQ